MTEAPAGSLGRFETYRSALDDTQIESYFAAPARQGKSPAVILLRGMAGPDSGYTEIADRLINQGYAALVHGWMVRGNDPDDTSLINDIQAAIGFLRSRPEVDINRTAIFGYCKGGGQAVLAAAACPELRVVVAFHGFCRRPDGPDAKHSNPIDVVGGINRPVLLLHGEQDKVSPVQSMHELYDALSKTGAPAQIHVYEGADHGFAVSTHKGYKEDAARDSFERAVAFLRQRLT